MVHSVARPGEPSSEEPSTKKRVSGGGRRKKKRPLPIFRRQKKKSAIGERPFSNRSEFQKSDFFVLHYRTENQKSIIHWRNIRARWQRVVKERKQQNTTQMVASNHRTNEIVITNWKGSTGAKRDGRCQERGHLTARGKRDLSHACGKGRFMRMTEIYTNHLRKEGPWEGTQNVPWESPPPKDVKGPSEDGCPNNFWSLLRPTGIDSSQR